MFGLISCFLGNRPFRLVLDGKSSQEYPNIHLMLEFLKAPFLVLHSSYYTLITFVMMLSVILLSMLMILLSILSVIRHLICGNTVNWLLNLNLVTVDWGKNWLIDFSSEKTQLVSFDWSNSNTASIHVKMDGSVLKDKLSFKILTLTSSKLHWGSYIISIAKTASKKIGALIRSMRFFSPEVALDLYKSTIYPFMKCYCQFMADAPSCHLELLDKLQKQIWRTVDPSLPASFEPLAHRRNLTSLSLFYWYYVGRCSSKLVQLVPFP